MKQILSFIVGLAMFGIIFSVVPQALASNERPDPYLEWLEQSYPSSGTGVVRVVDHFMNQDPEKAESLTVYVYTEETEDSGGITITVTETHHDTGIFEGTVFFSETHESGGHRIHVTNGEIVGAEYTYSIVPGSNLPENMQGIGHEIIIKNPQDVEQEVLPPKKQISNGTYSENVICKEGLELIFKYDNSPVCVKPETATKLIERSWATYTIIDFKPNEIMHTEISTSDYEDLCGYPVTDKMRLNLIFEQSYRFTKEGVPYFELNPGKFTHIELAQSYNPDDPHLNFWFELENGKQIAFRIGACDLDGSSIARYEKRS